MKSESDPVQRHPLIEWESLVRFVNDKPSLVGEMGVRDPDYICEGFDRRGYDGKGGCMSDGHYLCVECSELSPDSPRFTEYGSDGRRDRLLLFWRRRGTS